MKFFNTILLLLGLSVSAFAQLPNGSTAPDFTAKDINGKTWRLYDILESGRPVVMDISATWCGPCWSYHNSNALENYYAAHGPEGDARSMVLFVEGDGSTNTNCLYGASGCNSSTQGNWVLNTPYPIIDDATISGLYDIGYFPTVFLICPDKTVREVGQLNANALWTQASPCALTVPENMAIVAQFESGARTLELCGAQTIVPTALIGNFGTAHITSFQVQLLWNGAVLQQKDVNDVDIAVFDENEIAFDAVTISEPGTLTIKVSAVNGTDNAQEALKNIEFVTAPEKYTGDRVELRLRTDNFGKDLFWAILDENGAIIDQGGNPEVGLTGGGQFPNGAPDHPNAYGNNLNLRDTVNVPANGCFTIAMVDGRGDGLVAPGYYRLFNLGATSAFFSQLGTDSGFDAHAFAATTSGVADADIFGQFSVYPNPAAQMMTIATTSQEAVAVQIKLINTLGQTIRTHQKDAVAGENQWTISVNDLPEGLYFLQVQSRQGGVTRPVVIER